VHPLHHHHVRHAIVPVHLGDHHQIEALHVASQLRGVRSLAQQIEFVMKVFVELGHHLARLQAFAIARGAFDPAGHHAHQRQILFESPDHIGPQHLDSDLTATGQGGKVNLCNGRAGHRRVLKTLEYAVQRLAKRLFNDRYRHGRRKWRHPVLQPCQLVGNIGRQQVTARGQDLPELDKNRPQALKRLPQALASGRFQVASDRHNAGQQANPWFFKAGQHQFIQTKAQHGPDNKNSSENPAHAAALGGVGVTTLFTPSVSLSPCGGELA